MSIVRNTMLKNKRINVFLAILIKLLANFLRLKSGDELTFGNAPKAPQTPLPNKDGVFESA